MKKNVLIISVVCLCLCTVAYTYSAFSRTIVGNISATNAAWAFKANVAGASVENDYYKLPLTNSTGSFDIVVDNTDSKKNANFDIVLDKVNLPSDLKFYKDSSYSNEITNNIYTASSNKTSTTVKIYYKSDSSVNGSVRIKVRGTLRKGTSLYDYISSLTNNGSDSGIDFSKVPSATNGDGINIVSSTVDSTYPVYYYRGAVTNNNIIFANFCWKIVRTTETGGVKLLYNGVPTNGTCNNTKTATQLSKSSYFSTAVNSPIYVGYMQGLTAYNGNQYSDYKAHLEDTSVIDSSDTTTETIGTKTFAIAGRHAQNAKSSVVKIAIDTWYQTNIEGTSYADMLEDTVWCNNRETSTLTYTLDNVISKKYSYFNFQNKERLAASPFKPTLTCTRDIDKFTVSSANGNGDLEYPIGLITADEVAFAGSGYNATSKTYLYTGQYYWTMSPYYYNGGAYMFEYYASGTIRGVYAKNTSDSIGVRPAISLSNDVLITGTGDGTASNPIQVTY